MKEIKAMEQLQEITHYPQQYEDTINLMEIFSFFYAWRRMILGVTLLTTLLATCIAYYLPPQYKTIARLTPPKLFQFNQLLDNADLTISSEALFNKFNGQLKSKGNLFQFAIQSEAFKQALIKNPQLTENEKIQLANRIASSYNVINIENNETSDTKKSSHIAEIELETLSPQIDLKASANLAYLRFTNNRLINTLKNEQQIAVKQQINQLQEKMKLAIQKEKIERDNRIVRLKNEKQLAIEELNNNMVQLTQKDIQQRKLLLAQLTEAYELASATNHVGEKTRPQVQLASNETNQHQQLIDINLNQPQTDLYLKGTNYLRKAIELTKSQAHTAGYKQEILALRHQLNSIKNDPEIALIEQRKDDSAYVAELSNTLTQLDHLKRLTFNTDGVTAYNMDSDPEVGISPVSPKKAQIILIGAGLGFIGAIFLTFILNLRRQLRESIK